MKLLQEAQEEFDEVQEELRKKDTEEDSTASNLETGQATKSSNSNLLYTMLSRIFIQAFTMTFLAEWGDRSQLATIILAARENVTAVVIAGILGHAFCTGLAVLGKLPAFFIRVTQSSEFMGKTFQAARLTLERFLTIDHYSKIFF